MPLPEKIYCYDITEQSTCLSNVPEGSGCNVCGVHDCLDALSRLCQKQCELCQGRSELRSNIFLYC